MEAPIDFYRHFSWLKKVNLCSPANNETYQERLLRLEGDKESLVLQRLASQLCFCIGSFISEAARPLRDSVFGAHQVSVLTDQVEAQGEKIRDLESSLEEHRQKLASTEEMLQQELISRTSLETQKLDLMDEVSYLKLKLVSMEEDPAGSRPQDPTDAEQNKAEHLKGWWLPLCAGLCLCRGALLTRRPCIILDGAFVSDQEYQRLKVGMESLLASNDEKDRRIEELTVMLGQYRKMREVLSLTQGSSEEELSGSLKLRAITHKAHSDPTRPEVLSRGSSPLMLSSSPFQRELDSSFQNSVDTSLVSAGDPTFLNGSCYRRRLLSSSLEELQSGSLEKAVGIQPVEHESDVGAENPLAELSKYQTLPGKLRKKPEPRAELNGEREEEDEYLSPVQLSPAHGHPKDYCLRRSEKMEESPLSDQSPQSSGVDSGQQSPVSPENRKNHRGIKKLWGRIRRSQSGSPVQVNDPELGDFKRGGFRATAGPRLARPGKTRDLKLPFSKWNTEQVCDWLEDIGLGQYGFLARQWVISGQTLLSATPQDLEKVRSSLPASSRFMRGISARSVTPVSVLPVVLLRAHVQTDVSPPSAGAVHEEPAAPEEAPAVRWLDDIGLPQYKDQFNEGRVDGQVLQYLTVNDLLFLKVSSQLHHLSIKCAIHVLHVNKFDANCLKRRPGNEVSKPSRKCQFTPSEVVQWSNHRVMEWLRSVDLAEYAPNLRGSGVHGGLIMLEPRFNSDTLAMLLNISTQKTLLRRHLATNFNSLVGAQAQQEKREYMEAAGYTPLSITAKVKPKKLGFSNLTHLRRRRTDESTDYVCPIESSPSGPPAVNGVQMRPYAGFRGLSPILDREPARDQVGLEETPP
ncbi:unnamed protein product [Menidia menidia]|uniref:(Atlantic silverside) hypothetical protein n=1 Tax=Menidia menidia TaxID=238744 RepID=A0A8S4BA90_9TELE|nr:unnamed protein product [Menidia menidia]